MHTKGRTTGINAEMPMAEMLTFGAQLTSMTRGKGGYRTEVDYHDHVPAPGPAIRRPGGLVDSPGVLKCK